MPSDRVVYTTGYLGKRTAISSQKRGRLVEWVREHDAYLFDIRRVARAKDAAWCQRGLSQAFGTRYLHVPELGLLHGGVEPDADNIVDLSAGIEIVRASDRDVLLLCGCEFEAMCHRSIVARALAPHVREVRELTYWGEPRARIGYGKPAEWRPYA